MVIIGTSQLLFLFFHFRIISISILISPALSFYPLRPGPIHAPFTTGGPPHPSPITPPTPATPSLPRRPGRKSLPDGNALEFLIAHNRIRAQYGEPPLKWSRRLARFAHRYGRTLLDNCTGVHSNSPYGENIFWAPKKYWSPTRIVDAWASEAGGYDAKNKNCTTGILGCGHFTQIVWRDTARVGCQVMPCVGRGVIGICNYEPPGNYFNLSPFDSVINKKPQAGGVPPLPVSIAPPMTPPQTATVEYPPPAVVTLAPPPPPEVAHPSSVTPPAETATSVPGRWRQVVATKILTLGRRQGMQKVGV